MKKIKSKPPAPVDKEKYRESVVLAAQKKIVELRDRALTAPESFNK